jgi:hypothetical protein
MQQQVVQKSWVCEDTLMVPANICARVLKFCLILYITGFSAVATIQKPCSYLAVESAGKGWECHCTVQHCALILLL